MATAGPCVPLRSPDRALLASLRARIERIGGTDAAGVQRSRDALPLGIPPIDSVLPGGGLPRACLHEIVAADAGAAAAGFATVLLARLAGGDGSILWIRRVTGVRLKALWAGGCRLRPRSAPVAGGPRAPRGRRAVGDGGRPAQRRRLRRTRRGRHSPADRITPVTTGGGGGRRERPVAAAAGRRSRPWWGGIALAGGFRTDHLPRRAIPSLSHRERVGVRGSAPAFVGGSNCCAAVRPRRPAGSWTGAMRRIVSVWLPSFATDRLHRLRRNTTGAPPSEAGGSPGAQAALATAAAG